MCTLMEKDVLIEEVSDAAAFISNRFLDDSALPKEFDRCADIRDYLLRTTPQNIDINVIRRELNTIRAKFINLPEVLD
ncbi:hypothetical protein [Succinivibrio sp.]|uniref:hypothetical protein n=1 Tax=Succinivibrio sp. TaxID=2053619 RepID=UPI003870A224